MSPVGTVSTATAGAPAAPGAPPAPGAGPRRGLVRRHRATLLVAAAFATAVGVTAWTAGSPDTVTDLDPHNPDPDGARAVARVLDSEGVDVEVVRSIDDLEDTDLTPATTVVITSTDYLGSEVADRVRAHAGRAPVVLVEPGQGALDAFDLELGTGVGTPGGDRWPADCDSPAFAGLTLEVDDATAYTAAGCFTSDDADGAVLVTRGRVTAFGAGDALTNDQVLRGDNAAVTLRLLGGSDRLVWYVPTFEDLAPGEGVDAWSLVPDWVRPGLWLAAISLLVVALWRGRRLGPLATEPLPVNVKAVETTLSRGRLYRRAGDRAHAATRLRTASRDRVAARLGAGAGSDETALLRDVARHTGRPVERVTDLLATTAPVPTNDRQLVQLASDLAELEEEVRRR